MAPSSIEPLSFDRSRRMSRTRLFKNLEMNMQLVPFEPLGVERLMVALREDRKIDAIKEIRVITGCGLKEAKDMFEGIIDGILKSVRTDVLRSVKTDVGRLMVALRDSQKIDAIKEVRALTGQGLKEAKDMVEATIDGIFRTSKPQTVTEAGIFFVLDEDAHLGSYCNLSDAIEHAKERLGSSFYIARAEKRVTVVVHVDDVD
jgi:ribosomal protein L7/L12